MRRPVDAERIHRFMRELGREAEGDVRLYFTGGATAVLLGWRMSTIDVDIKMEPESDRLFRALPRIKDNLEVNIELAAPPPVCRSQTAEWTQATSLKSAMERPGPQLSGFAVTWQVGARSLGKFFFVRRLAEGQRFRNSR